MALTEIGQWAGVAVTALGSAVGYGRLKQKVDQTERRTEDHVTKDAFQPFADEVLRRLARIEAKQDTAANGRPKPNP